MHKKFKKYIYYLLYKSSHTNIVGLYYGKIGITLALFAYSKKYNDHILQEFASHLLEETYAMLHESMPINIEYGLSGVGLGISILHKAKFISGDLNEILCDIDRKIMELDPRRATDFSYRTGVLGIFSYIKYREKVDPTLTSFDSLYISELTNIIKYHNIQMVNETYFIHDIQPPTWNKHDYIDKPLGINKGISYHIIQDCYDKLFLNI